MVAGGVGANVRLRETLDRAGREQGINVYYPSPEFCTDNGAMVALAGCLRLQASQNQSLAFQVRARWPLTELTAL